MVLGLGRLACVVAAAALALALPAASALGTTGHDHGSVATSSLAATTPPAGGHDRHGVTPPAGGHDQHDVVTPADRPRREVLTGFVVVNGAVVLTAAMLRRRTRARRCRPRTSQ